MKLSINNQDTKEAMLNAGIDIYLNLLKNKNITFTSFYPFKKIDGKNYFEKTITHLVYSSGQKNEKKLPINTIIFKSGDGTGDETSYFNEDLVIPEEFQVKKKPSRANPRNKDGIIAEIVFPFGSFYKGKYVPNAISLDELILEKPGDPNVKKGFTLGMEKEKYCDQMIICYEKNIFGKIKPYLTTTLWHDIEGNRIGDPHAITHNVYNINIYQMVGFLAITKKNEKVLSLLKEHIKKPKPA